jgi:hypothetical protein
MCYPCPRTVLLPLSPDRTVACPNRHIDVFGAQVPWLDVYIVLSIVFALALKRPLAGLLPYRRRRRGGVLQTSSVGTVSPAK